MMFYRSEGVISLYLQDGVFYVNHAVKWGPICFYIVLLLGNCGLDYSRNSVLIGHGLLTALQFFSM